jgi:hypothetical protein
MFNYNRDFGKNVFLAKVPDKLCWWHLRPQREAVTPDGGARLSEPLSRYFPKRTFVDNILSFSLCTFLNSQNLPLKSII